MSGAVPEPDASAAAADLVVRGIAHELGNRTGTIAAAAEALAAADPASRYAAVLADEARRLDALLRLLRLVPLDPARPPEPARPADLTADAVALFALHARGREARVAAEALDDAPPVRVHLAAVVRALVVLLDAARGAGDRVRLEHGGTDADLALRVAGAGSAATHAAEPAIAAAVAAARALVAADGGEVEHDATNGALVLRLPTLAELRRRERDGR